MADKTVLALNYILSQCLRMGIRKPSAPKLSRLLYLCDWHYALIYDRQISNIAWEVQLTGIEPDPKSSNKIEAVASSRSLTRGFLSNAEKNVINQVLAKTKRFNILELKNYADSTYPSISQLELGSQINFPDVAKQYKEHQKIKQQKIRQEIAYTDEQMDRIQ